MIAAVLGYISSFVLATIGRLGYGGVFGLMLLESAGIPIPSEIIMPFSGFLVSRGSTELTTGGVFNFWLVVALGTLGNVVGSLLFYWLGSWWSAQSLKPGNAVGSVPTPVRRWLFFLSSGELERAERWFGRWGNWAVFFSRMLPVVRTYIAFPAGVARMKVLPFTVLTFAGSLPWVLVLTWIGVQLGERWETLRGYFERFDLVLGGLLVIGLVWVLWRRYRLKNTNVAPALAGNDGEKNGLTDEK